MIQEDIGGHPPIPLRPPPLFYFSFPVSLIVAQFTIFGSFRVLNFRSRFEALNEVFRHQMVGKYESILNLTFVIYGCSP